MHQHISALIQGENYTFPIFLSNLHYINNDAIVKRDFASYKTHAVFSETCLPHKLFGFSIGPFFAFLVPIYNLAEYSTFFYFTFTILFLRVILRAVRPELSSWKAVSLCCQKSLTGCIYFGGLRRGADVDRQWLWDRTYCVCTNTALPVWEGVPSDRAQQPRHSTATGFLLCALCPPPPPPAPLQPFSLLLF